MRLMNFNFGSSVEIAIGERDVKLNTYEKYYDLHNCFDWEGFFFWPEERRLQMIWRAAVGVPKFPMEGSLLDTNARKLTLEFRLVTGLAAMPRDLQMPFTEDTCLDFVTFTPSDRSTDFENEYEGFRSNDEHLTFRFRSGTSLKIWAAEAHLLVENNDGDTVGSEEKKN